jgi:isopenicillin N synthase-like dioxygenase
MTIVDPKDATKQITVKYGGLEVYSSETSEWIQVQIPQDSNALVVNAGNVFALLCVRNFRFF